MLNTIDTKFSIIMPVFNVVEYVEEAIKSVIRQTYTNWELILIDDGSTDGSEKILATYFENDRRIKLVKKENSGVSASRNIGISEATGDYILFLDSDDALKTDALEIIETYNSGNNQVVLFDFCREFYDNVVKEINTKILDSKGIVISILKNKRQGYAWQFAISKKMLDKIELFDNSLIMCEDLVWTLKLLSETDSVLYIDEKLYMYRIRENSIVQTNSLKAIRSLELAMNQVKESVNKHFPSLKKYLTMWVNNTSISNYYNYSILGVINEKEGYSKNEIIKKGIKGLSFRHKILFYLIKYNLLEKYVGKYK